MSEPLTQVNDLIVEADRQCAADPLKTLRFPPGLITETSSWLQYLGNSISCVDEKKKFADTLIGCEIHAWFIDRYNTYGAGRAVPAKVLLHQLLDLVDRFIELRKKGDSFKERLRKLLNAEEDSTLKQDIEELWEIRHRSHMRAVGDDRDHGYAYFPPIGKAWSAFLNLIARFGGDLSQYRGLLSTIAGREEERVLSNKAKIDL